MILPYNHNLSSISSLLSIYLSSYISNMPIQYIFNLSIISSYHLFICHLSSIYASFIYKSTINHLLSVYLSSIYILIVYIISIIQYNLCIYHLSIYYSSLYHFISISHLAIYLSHICLYHSEVFFLLSHCQPYSNELMHTSVQSTMFSQFVLLIAVT